MRKKQNLTERQRQARRLEQARERRARYRSDREALWLSRGWLKADQLPWSRSTVWRLEKRGVLKSTRIAGRNWYRISDVERLLGMEHANSDGGIATAPSSANAAAAAATA